MTRFSHNLPPPQKPQMLTTELAQRAKPQAACGKEYPAQSNARYMVPGIPGIYLMNNWWLDVPGTS